MIHGILTLVSTGIPAKFVALGAEWGGLGYGTLILGGGGTLILGGGGC